MVNVKGTYSFFGPFNFRKILHIVLNNILHQRKLNKPEILFHTTNDNLSYSTHLSTPKLSSSQVYPKIAIATDC